MFTIDEIIQGCARKDPAYQKIVYERFYGFALKIVFRYIYRYDSAVDIANDGFVKFFQHAHRFRTDLAINSERMLMGFIKKIMINVAIDELRKNRMTPEIGGIPEYVWSISSKEQEADQQLVYKELIILVKSLPPQYRAVFNLYVIDGFSHLEIADLLAIPVGTSKSNLSRARTLLQQSIKKSENPVTCSI